MHYKIDITPRLTQVRRFLAELDRNQLAVLDLGSRDGKVLRDLSCRGSYSRLVATDLHHRIDEDIEFVEHNLENLLPFEDNSFDIVICTDVLEHVEQKRQLIGEIQRVSREWVVISLPNTQHRKYVRGLRKGYMGKQYRFLVDDGVDRHRWITFYKDNVSFVEEYFLIVQQIDVCDKQSDTLPARFFPSSYVRNQIFFCGMKV